MDMCIHKEGFVQDEGRTSAFSSGASEVWSVAKGQECLPWAPAISETPHTQSSMPPPKFPRHKLKHNSEQAFLIVLRCN